MSGNSASQSSAGANIDNTGTDGGDANVTVANSIFEAPPGQANFSNGSAAFFTSEGYNLGNDAAGGDGAPGPGGVLSAFGDVRNTDPLLAPLQNNGGPTPTHALLPGSPAIDMGKSFGATTDQRGKPRPFNNPTIPPASGGDNSDIGAFEVRAVFQGGPVFTVNKIEDHDDGVCSAADCTLREAIVVANQQAGDNTINFAPEIAGTIQLVAELPHLTSNLELAGPGARKCSHRPASERRALPHFHDY